MTTKLLFVVNVDWFFLSHRLPIAQAAIAQGFDVHIACTDTGKSDTLRQYGLTVHTLPIARGRADPFNALKVLLYLLRLYRNLRPNLIHLVTIKPVLIGGIAARLAGISRVVAAISGLGFVFTAEGTRARLRRFLVGIIYKLALRRPGVHVIVQNKDDQRYICNVIGLPLDRTTLIAGSGVRLASYSVLPEPEGVPLVLFAGRLLRDKGVLEFCEAASIARNEGVSARFALAGDLDLDNPSGITLQDQHRLAQDCGVEFWGYRPDMAQTLSDACIVVLPSYREGLPKVLIEAAACGRAVITTDVPGCRDAIIPEITGVLVPVKNTEMLARAIKNLVRDPILRETMGLAGRQYAEREFDIANVVDKHIEIYENLLRTSQKNLFFG